MNNKLKSFIAVLVVAVIVSAFAIPAFAGMYGLTYTAGWEANDVPHQLEARVTLSFSGGNGREVYCSAIAETNLHYYSIITQWTHATSASFVGAYMPYELEIPFVTGYDGYAIYTGKP